VAAEGRDLEPDPGQHLGVIDHQRGLGRRQLDHRRKQQALDRDLVAIGAIAQALKGHALVGGVLVDQDQLAVAFAQEVGAIELAEVAQPGEVAVGRRRRVVVGRSRLDGLVGRGRPGTRARRRGRLG
jgi:hypothetical protein